MEQSQQKENNESDDSFEAIHDNQTMNEEEVQEYYALNYEKVISNYLKYYDSRNEMYKTISSFTAFEGKIEKIRKSNMYDIREINNKTNQIVNITQVLALLMVVKNNVQLAQKSIAALKIEKYTSAIRHYQKINYNNKPAEELFQKINQLVVSKVQGEADKKINYWVESFKQSQIQMGMAVISNCEQLLNQNQQFGRISLFQPDTRSSIVMRTSIVNNQNQRQSLISQQMTRPQSIRISNVHQLANRVSFFQQFNQGVNKSSNSRESLQNQSVSNMSFQNIQDLQEQQIWEFEIDFSNLKLPQLLYENLNQKNKFIQQLKQFRMQYLQYICQGEKKYQIQDFREYLASLMGFILMEFELGKGFKEYEEMNSVVIENFKQIERHIKQNFLKGELQDLLLIKKELHLFSLALSKVKLYQISNAINKCMNDQFIVFSNRRIENIKQILNNCIKNDKGGILQLENKERVDQLCQIFNIQPIQNKRSLKYELPISQFASEVVDQINEFIDGSIQYLSNLNEYFDQNVIFYMDTLFLQICEVFKDFVQTPNTFLLLVQQTVNFNYIEKSIVYYKRHIQRLLQVSSTKEFECLSHFKNTHYFCEEAIQNAINTKLEIGNIEWYPSTPNKGPHDQFLIIYGYYESILSTLQLMLPQFVQTSIYLTFKQINQLIWQSLINAKHFNILGLVNIELDLQCLLKQCNLNNYPESIKETIQFINLFLNDSILSYLDQNKRLQNFGYLSSQKLLKVLPKYKKLVYQKYPEVRKRDVETLTKKIQDNPQMF